MSIVFLKVSISLPNGKRVQKVFNYLNKDSLTAFDRAQVTLWKEHRYNLHQLRKTYITRLLEVGLPVEDVKEFARLSSKSMQIILDHYREVKNLALVTKADKLFQEYSTKHPHAHTYAYPYAYSGGEQAQKKGKQSPTYPAKPSKSCSNSSACGIRTRDLRLERAAS